MSDEITAGMFVLSKANYREEPIKILYTLHCRVRYNIKS